MRNIITICAIFLLAGPIHARNYFLPDKGESISAALADFARSNPDVDINFIYNDLDAYKVKSDVKASSAIEAVRKLVALNPVTVLEVEGTIYVEPLQKGKFRYTGRILSDLHEPVAFATVLLLTPRDSTVVTYGVTDDSGRFSIPCDRKGLLAKVTSIGYKTLYRQATSSDMGTLVMETHAVALNNVTATADSRYALRDRTVYVPSRREKNAAAGGADLLKLMAIPSLNIAISDDNIRTLAGAPVATFIDYMPATSQDLANLLPADVKRVEVLDFPDDPRFQGALHVVNFIMVKYVFGGYTRISDWQRLNFKEGKYNLASRFTYCKMTYDLAAGYDHARSDKMSDISTTTYHFPDQSVTRTDHGLASKAENNESYVSMKAQFANDATVISNQLSLRYHRRPNGFSEEETSYEPEIYPDAKSISQSNHRSLTPSWSGNYQFILPRNITLAINSSATYARNNSHTLFSESDTRILNKVKEDAWKAYLNGGLTKKWGDNSLGFSINGELAGNKLHYSGDNPADIDYMFKAIGAFVRGNFSIGKFWIQPSAKFFLSATSFGDEHFSQPLPGYYIAGGISFNQKHQFSFDSEMSQFTIGAAQRSPNIVVRNMLDAVKGNPDLKTWLYNSVSASYVWLPMQWLNFSAGVSYVRHTKPAVFKYEPTTINGRQMMLCTYMKNGYFQTLSESLSVVARLFNNALTLQGYLSIESHRRGGIVRFNRTVVNSQLSATAFLRDFYIQGAYQFKGKNAYTASQISDTPSYYSLRVGWSHKGLNLSALLQNPFRSSLRAGNTLSDAGNYRQVSESFSDDFRRQIWISAVYSISYGKKVGHGGIGRGATVDSGIVE